MDSLTVTYEKGIDSELDRRLIAAIEPLGYEWYGQGIEIQSGKRDISFREKSADE